MHSQLALAEHVSLNLAPLILLHPVDKKTYSVDVGNGLLMWQNGKGVKYKTESHLSEIVLEPLPLPPLMR